MALIEPRTWVPGSPWLAGLDPARFGADETGLAGVAGGVLAAASAGAAWLSPWDYQVSSDVIGAAHEAGLRVAPWTVNNPGRMAALMSLGADAIVTDRPDVLRSVIAESGGLLPDACELPWADGAPGWGPYVPGR